MRVIGRWSEGDREVSHEGLEDLGERLCKLAKDLHDAIAAAKAQVAEPPACACWPEGAAAGCLLACVTCNFYGNYIKYMFSYYVYLIFTNTSSFTGVFNLFFQFIS